MLYKTSHIAAALTMVEGLECYLHNFKAHFLSSSGNLQVFRDLKEACVPYPRKPCQYIVSTTGGAARTGSTRQPNRRARKQKTINDWYSLLLRNIVNPCVVLQTPSKSAAQSVATDSTTAQQGILPCAGGK